MKKSNKFFKKIATITLSCTSLLQFTSVFAGGSGNQNSNSSTGKSPLSVFRASNPLYYKVIPDAVADGPNSHKPPRPTHSQKKEQNLTPKKPTKVSPTEAEESIGIYMFPAGTRNITNFADFKTVRPTNCLNHHGVPAKYSNLNRQSHYIVYRNKCGCTNCTVTYSDLGGILGWKLARASVLAGYKVPEAQENRSEWDIYANPRHNSDLERTLISQGLWIERMRLTAIPDNLKYADGGEFTEIDKRIFCEIRTKEAPPEWKEEYRKWTYNLQD